LRCWALVAVDRSGRTKIKTAVGAFDGDGLSDIQGLRKLAGVVAEGFDGEGEGAGWRCQTEAMVKGRPRWLSTLVRGNSG
jgi:hypothetical protein